MAPLLTRTAAILVIATVTTLAGGALAHASVIQSITAGRSVTGSSMTTLLDDTHGYTIRCTHNITIPTTAFGGTNSVSIETANNNYTSCTDNLGGTCVVRVDGRWTLTASSTTSGVVRLDNSVSVECRRSGGGGYTCGLRVASGQTLNVTFVNPVSPARTGTLRVDTPNTLRYTVDVSSSCLLGGVRTVGTATMSETISTDNVQIVP